MWPAAAPSRLVVAARSSEDRHRLGPAAVVVVDGAVVEVEDEVGAVVDGSGTGFLVSRPQPVRATASTVATST
jgi:hypothetical protein